MWPRRQPRRRLVLLSGWCLYLRCRSGRRHWRIDTALRTHLVVVDDIHCRLSTHCHNSQGTVSQQFLLQCLTTHTTVSNPKRATCRFLKYYYKFASRVRSFTGSSKHFAWFVSFPSNVFVLSPASITVPLCVRRQTIASCALAARPMFSESSSHTAHTVLSSSLERCQKLRNQLLYTPGNDGSV